VTEAVLDASALIAFLRDEPGADRVASVLANCCISAVNLSETLSKMIEYGKPLDAASYQIERLRVPVIGFEAESAKIVASLWKESRAAGLSLGDRACLALGLKIGCPVMTTDKAWSGCDVGVKIIQIR